MCRGFEDHAEKYVEGVQKSLQWSYIEEPLPPGCARAPRHRRHGFRFDRRCPVPLSSSGQAVAGRPGSAILWPYDITIPSEGREKRPSRRGSRISTQASICHGLRTRQHRDIARAKSPPATGRLIADAGSAANAATSGATSATLPGCGRPWSRTSRRTTIRASSSPEGGRSSCIA